jgi:hypothetical protein
MIDDDSDIDLWEPVAFETRQCPHCKTYIVEGEAADAYWVVENPTDGFYTPYCNEFHYQAHHRIGVFKEEKPLGLTLD